jgi:hypothetical protein
LPLKTRAPFLKMVTRQRLPTTFWSTSNSVSSRPSSSFDFSFQVAPALQRPLLMTPLSSRCPPASAAGARTSRAVASAAMPINVSFRISFPPLGIVWIRG